MNREAKDDHSIVKRFEINIKIFLFQAHHGPISRRKSSSGSPVEGHPIF
jgi:hypothetical protein